MSNSVKITYIDSAGRIRRWRMPREGHSDLLASEEGVAWIRGHHADDSPEVRAMLAAHSLARGSAVVVSNSVNQEQQCEPEDRESSSR